MMTPDVNAWKTETWAVHPEVKHAIMIPGYGFYGGLPEDVAQGIVDAMNAQRKIVAAVHKLLSGPGLTPFVENL